MVRATGRYRKQCVELDQPIELAEGTSVEVQIRPVAEPQGIERRQWAELGMDRLEEEWDNPEDAIYDEWKKLYGVSLS